MPNWLKKFLGFFGWKEKTDEGQKEPAPSIPSEPKSEPEPEEPKVVPPPITGPIYRHRKNTPAMVAEYQKNWDTMHFDPKRRTAIARAAEKIMANLDTYKAIAYSVLESHARTDAEIEDFAKIIGAIHMKESSFRFDRHLHNGDSLTARTHQVPAGRPKLPPKNGKIYTFAESAEDALEYEFDAKGIDRKRYVFDVPNTLYFLETYNGFGYRSKGINSPYLYAFCDKYTRGRYVRDGVYDPNSVAENCGSAVVLKWLGFHG